MTTKDTTAGGVEAVRSALTFLDQLIELVAQADYAYEEQEDNEAFLRLGKKLASWQYDGTFASYRDELAAALAASPAPAQAAGVEGWTLADLRACNTDRQAAWCPEQVPDLSFRGNELGGEVGEALNVIKKLERERHGWRGSRDTVEHLAEELADVVICADLAALTAGVDLMAAVKAKFDATSEKVGLPHRLTAAPSPKAGETGNG